MSLLNSISCILFISFLFVSIKSAPIEDEITILPGWSPRPLSSKQYSVFLNASDDGNMQMHYWMALSENDPENAPIMIWLNGGPGASSLYGFLVELGPYLLSDLSLVGPEYELTGIPQLMYNPYGWQKFANVIALSMPPPIGFSYCNPPGPSATGSDCGSWNDTSVAEVTYHAILSLMKKFPEF